MPVGAGLIIGGAIAGGSSLASAHMQTKASDKSATIQQQSTDAALDFEKSVDERQNKQYEEEQAYKKEQDVLANARAEQNLALLEQDREQARAELAWKEADKARAVGQSAPFVNLGSQSANTLAGMLTGGNGGNWAVTATPPNRSLVPPSSPLPGAAPRVPAVSLADLLARR